MLLSENPKQGSEQCIQYSAFYLIKEKKIHIHILKILWKDK